MNNNHRKLAGALLAGALLCGTAACSSDTKDSAAKSTGTAAEKPVEVTPAVAIKKASEQTSKLTSFSYSMSGKVPGGGSVEGEASMSLKPLAMQMRMKSSGSAEKDANGETEIRLTDDGMYIGAGAKAAKELGGKSWMKFPASAMQEAVKGAPGAAGVSDQAGKNPADQSAAMTAAKDLKKIGTETVDGVNTTHYSGTVTVADMRSGLAGLDAEAKKRREATIKAYQDMGLDSIAMDMWTDEENHTKQFRTRGDTAKGPLDLTIKFLSFNEPVKVAAPPASEVMDLGAMMKESSAG